MSCQPEKGLIQSSSAKRAQAATCIRQPVRLKAPVAVGVKPPPRALLTLQLYSMPPTASPKTPRVREGSSVPQSPEAMNKVAGKHAGWAMSGLPPTMSGFT